MFRRRKPGQAAPASAGSRVERYLAHLDSLSGGIEPEFHPIETTKPPLKGVVAITYRSLPEPGLMTALTYGLSLAEHEEWRLGKPELCICVRSSDISWALAAAFLAEQLRGECPFRYGDTLGFGDRMSAESEMTAFVVFAPAVLDRESFLNIEVGDALPINIAGLYPIYESERAFIRDQGLEAFWQLDWDPYDVTRRPVA